MTDQKRELQNVKLGSDGESVEIVDQSQLPNRVVKLTLRSPRDFFEAIYELKVRGAPAIGICAGYGIYCLARQIKSRDYNEFHDRFVEQKDYLNSARPTAVNLSWALERMYRVVRENAGTPLNEIVELLKNECISIHEEDIAMCQAISGYGLELLKDGDGVLTHCNAGPLATSRYGTALGPLILGHEEGMNFRVFADETRPLLQGARLTTFELHEAGIDVTLICDNMASIVMKQGWIQACLVGSDRIAANGDAANKIGTSGVAILAKHYDIPFYVLAPTSSIDMKCKTGEDIEIEERPPEEIKFKWYKEAMAPEEVKCYNPAFDVTDHSLITAIVTEKGICRAPYRESLARLYE